MAQNKSTVFTTDEQALAAFAKALSHPARIAIVRTLADCDSCICGEIVEVLPLSQSTVSQHLKALKEAGIVQGAVEGVRTCYCLNHDFLQRMQTVFQDWLQSVAFPKSGCC